MFWYDSMREEALSSSVRLSPTIFSFDILEGRSPSVTRPCSLLIERNCQTSHFQETFPWNPRKRSRNERFFLHGISSFGAPLEWTGSGAMDRTRECQSSPTLKRRRWGILESEGLFGCLWFDFPRLRSHALLLPPLARSRSTSTEHFCWKISAFWEFKMWPKQPSPVPLLSIVSHVGPGNSNTNTLG